jgi:tetratricopeptide (TPR) repeat protein
VQQRLTYARLSLKKGDSVESRNWLVLAAALAALAAAPSQLPEALEAQRTQAESNPRDPEVLNDLANLLVLSGELEEAEGVYGRALELDPERASTRYNLALLQQESGRDREAFAEYQRVLESDPGHAWANYQLGILYAARGRRSRAVKHYARALALKPDLLLPEVNPHIIENRFATEALLLARRSESPAAFAPRLYQQPTRVAELLVPRLPEVQEPLNEESRTARDEVGRPQSRTKWTQPVEEDVEEDDDEADETIRAELPSQQRGEYIPEGDPRGGGATQQQPTAGSQRPRPPIGVIRVTVPPSSVPSTSTPPRTGAPGPSQPGLPSTGRLDLQLLASDSDLLAALPLPPRPRDEMDG